MIFTSFQNNLAVIGKENHAMAPLSFTSTYFIEYVFPVASTSSRHDRSKSGDGEVTRAAASKVTGGSMTSYYTPY